MVAQTLDHIVLAHPQLDRAREEFADLTGCMPAYGGPHLGGGTHNALVSLGDSVYIELISPDPEQSAAVADQQGLAQRLAAVAGQQLLAWAVRSNDLGALREQLQSKAPGVRLSRPFEMAREQPDGVTLAWQLMNAADQGLAGFAPFYIDWLRCAHPARTNPVAGQFDSLRIQHDSPILAALCEDVGNVEFALGPANFQLCFATARGEVELAAHTLEGFWG